MKIYDDLVKKQNAKQIEDFLLKEDFPWFYVKSSSGDSKKIKGFTDTIQFEHHFITYKQGVTSQAIHYVMQMFDWDNLREKVNVSESVLRMKSNLLLQTQNTPNTPHIDYKFPHDVLLYYVNDSDGETIFYDSELNEIKKVNPKRGRIVVFDGSQYHSSTPPLKNKCRCVINMNLSHT